MDSTEPLKHLLIHLRKAFAQAANPEMAQKQSAYLRNLFPFYGIPMPERTLLQKPLIRQYPLCSADLEKLTQEFWKHEQREFQYAAVDILRHYRSLWTPSFLMLFEEMIRTKAWWDTVDTIAANLVGDLLTVYPDLIETMDIWIANSCLWIRRTAIIFQLKWKEKTQQERLYRYCLQVAHEKDFFIRKAIGWALRQYAKTSPKEVERFLQKHHRKLSPLSLREATRHWPLGKKNSLLSNEPVLAFQLFE